MRNRIFQPRRHLESQGPRPGGLGFLVGFACYCYYEYRISRQNDKRVDELRNDFSRRAQVIIDGRNEINELIHNEFVRRAQAAQLIIDGTNEILRHISGGKS